MELKMEPLIEPIIDPGGSLKNIRAARSFLLARGINNGFKNGINNGINNAINN